MRGGPSPFEARDSPAAASLPSTPLTLSFSVQIVCRIVASRKQNQMGVNHRRTPPHTGKQRAERKLSTLLFTLRQHTTTSQLSMRGPCTLKPESFLPTFSDSQLAGLKEDLARAKLPRPTYASNQPQYGIEFQWMESALDRWKNGFDWRSREAGLHSVNHFMVDVPDEASETGSFKIHFIAEYSKDPDAIPLLLLHGCASFFQRPLATPVAHFLR